MISSAFRRDQLERRDLARGHGLAQVPRAAFDDKPAGIYVSADNEARTDELLFFCRFTGMKATRRAAFRSSDNNGSQLR